MLIRIKQEQICIHQIREFFYLYRAVFYVRGSDFLFLLLLYVYYY